MTRFHADLKYIIFRDDITGWENAVLFCDELVHSYVAVEGHTAVAAGLIDPHTWECSDDSESLGLKSRGQTDKDVVALALTPNSMRIILRYARTDRENEETL